MSQQDAAKEQANTRKNVRIVSVFTAAAIGIVGVLVILAVSGTYVEPYQSPLGQVILVALLAMYVATLVWMKRMAIGRAMPRFLSPVPTTTRDGAA